MNNNNNMWGFNNPYNNFPALSFPYNNSVGNLSRSNSNKIFVTSIEDALSRYAEPNSEMIYLNQDKPLLYEIKTDSQGRKMVNAYNITPSVEKSGAGAENADMSNYVTKTELEALRGQIKALEDKINNGGVV